MLPQHVFSHQHQYPHVDPSWQLQQQQNHHPQHPHHGQQNVQAAAAAAAAAQQQHYNRVAGNNNGGTPGMGGDHTQSFGTSDQSMSAEERRILEWIAQLMSPNTRESALLELSKKREQFPQLALILWHSFGTYHFLKELDPQKLTIVVRRHDFPAPRNHLSLPSPQPVSAHRRRVEPSMQCPRPSAVRRFTHRDTISLP